MEALKQGEADALLALEKRARDAIEYRLPPQRGKLTIPIVDLNEREEFTLDLSRGGISLERRTYMHRVRLTIILARLDFGSPHRNPDDVEVGVPHLHLYREGFADKWAFPVPADRFQNPADLWQTLLDFMNFCNISQRPLIKNELSV